MTETQDDSAILRYGQIVLLHYFDDENGFISADGHVKKNVQMKGYGKYYSSWYAAKHDTKEINKDDFSNCLFQIFPKVVNTQKTKIIKEIETYRAQKLREEDKNEITKEKLQMLDFAQPIEKNPNEKPGNDKKNANNPNNNQGAQQGAAVPEEGQEDKDELLKKIYKYQLTLQNEFKYNVDTFENNKNIPLSFSQPFQLLHLNSSKFLSCNFTESRYEKENYEISMEEYSSDSTLFKIVPAFKYQKDSSAMIREGDCVWIVRAIPFNNKTIHIHCSMEINEMKRRTQLQKQIAHQTFLNASSIQSTAQTPYRKKALNKGEQKSKGKQIHMDTLKEKDNVGIDKREINGCLEQATTLQFKIFQDSESIKSKFLNCGDAIWLHHSEANSALSLIRRERGTTRYTFTSLHLETWIAKSNLELFVAQTKESGSFEDYSGNTFGLWVIENVNFKIGGQVEYGVGYRLKHLSTGYYLTVIDENALMIDQKFKDLYEEEQQAVKNNSIKHSKQINKARYDTEEKEEISEKDEEEDDDEDEELEQIDESPKMIEDQVQNEDKLDDVIDNIDQQKDEDIEGGNSKRNTVNFESNLTTARTGDSTNKNQALLIAEETKKLNKKKPKKKKKIDKEAELRALKLKMPKKWKLSLTTNANDPFALFQFFALGTSASIYEQYVEQGNFVFLRNIESKQWLDVVNLLLSQQPENIDIPAQMKNFVNQNQLSEFNQNDSLSAFSPLRAVLKSEQAENQVFKLFQIPSNEVWEAKFVLSCSNVLLKFLLNQQTLNNLCNTGDEIAIRNAKAKIKVSRTCIQNINNFCSNRLLNFQPEQKLGVPNPRRQKLLREQYYIDFLVKILEDLLPKQELELWIEYKMLEKKEKEKNQSDDDSEDEDIPENNKFKNIPGFGTSQKRKKNKISHAKLNRLSSRKDHANYLKEKVDMAKDIYNLLVTLCKNNQTNEEYTFKLIPFFQIHCKYIPEAIDCLISLVSNNEKILYALSDTLKVDFDYEKKEEDDEFQKKAVQIIINLYENDNDKQGNNNNDEEKMPFRQHEKITTKPINLIMFFMNLIWDKTSKFQSYYLKFLRSVCRFHNKGISLNQENIFKIYKKYTRIRNVIRYDQYFKSGSIKLPENASDAKKQEFEYDVSEQMKFYSELSFGRNFLWRKELIPHFSNFYLLQNIWNQDDLKEYPLLRSCFCQLAMSLYIDHEPLQRRKIPNYCRLYETVGEEVEEKVFDEQKNQENEIVMYKTLIQSLGKYLREIHSQVESLTDTQAIKEKSKKEMVFKITKKSESIVQNSLLLNSLELLHLLVVLSLFESLQVTQYYQNIVPNLLHILVYDLKNVEYFTACAYTLKEQNKTRKEDKEKRKNPNLFGLANINSKLKNAASSLNKTVNAVSGQPGDDEKKNQNEIDYELDQQEIANLLESGQLYDNHIMRGQVKLHNQLEEMNYSDSAGYHIEIKVKLKVLDIIEHFLDLRQNYLMTNLVTFFKQNISPEALKTKNPKDPVEIRKKMQEIVREHLKGFLPDIPLTGISAVDKLFVKEESLNLLKNLSKLNIVSKKQTKPPPKKQFTSYITKTGYVHYQDINNLLSAQFEQTNAFDDPVTTCLPQLLSSFLILYDEELEKRLLKVLLRMYNQRYDLLDNIDKLQIIFDTHTNQLFLRLEDMLMQLNKYVEQSEVWFTTLAGNTNKTHQIFELQRLLESINNGYFNCLLRAEDGAIILLNNTIPREYQTVNKEKQKIYQYLQLQEPILSLLKEGMHHFDSFILDENYPQDKKQHLIKLFELVYEFLYYFTVNSKENQAIMKKHYKLFTKYLKYDLGQIKLICAIYKDNNSLLTEIHKPFINTFIELIETEGKQTQFLDIFEVILKHDNKYVFDNQLLILNTFLPQKGIGEKEYNLLYANGSSIKSFRFYLEDICKSLEVQKLNEKLTQVDYRDTYRDEPFLYHIKLLQLLLEACCVTIEEEQQKPAKDEGSVPIEKKIQVNFPENNLLVDQEIILKDDEEWGNDFEIDQKEDELQKQSQKLLQEQQQKQQQLQQKNKKQNQGAKQNEKPPAVAIINNNLEEEEDETRKTEERKLEDLKNKQNKLLATWKSDPLFADKKFNISISRLKKVFKVFDLLQMIGLEDDYANWSKFSNQINKKNKIVQKIKETEGKCGIFEEALNDKEAEEKKRQIEESKKQFLSAAQYQDEIYQQQKEMAKKGMSLLKPHLLEFMRYVHIASETVISANSEMITQQKEIASFFDKEGLKIMCLTQGAFRQDYVSYIFDNLLVFMYEYYKKFVERGPHNNHIQEDEERRDDKALELLLEKILNKLPLFKFHITPLQKQRIILLTKTIKGLGYKIIVTSPTNEGNLTGNGNNNEHMSNPRRLPPLNKNLSSGQQYTPQQLISSPQKPNLSYKTINAQVERKTSIDYNNQGGAEIPDGASDLNDDDQINLLQQQQGSSKNIPSGLNVNQNTKKTQKMQGKRNNNNNHYLLNKSKKKVQQKLKAVKMTSRVQVQNKIHTTQQSEYYWSVFKSILKSDYNVQEEVKKEKIALAEAIVRVKQIVKPELAKDLILKPDMFKLIKKFIKFLQYAPEDPKNKETIISLISVLKEVIESKGIEKIKKENVDEKKEAEKKLKIQIMFNQLGAMKMILTVLSQNNPHLDNELIINYLSLANCLLEGGNSQIQNTIYQFFMTYQKSEEIFHRFNLIIKNQIRNIEHLSKQINKNSQATSNKTNSSNNQMIQLLEMVLRFLQLCVEGHYIDNQNYLRRQINSRNNYDMVQGVAELLKAYYYGDCTQRMYDNMIFCLDTLSEFVQGPCRDNQEAVSDSKFFDIASDLFAKKTKTEEQKQVIKERKQRQKEIKSKDMNLIEQYRKSSGEPLTEWMIARLQNKVLILVLSLLESREVKNNCEIIKRIMRNLPPYVLQRHLIKSFKRFQGYYGDNFNRSSLSHMEKDPRNEDDQDFFRQLIKNKKTVDEYLECILQNGFQIYFLLSYYIESDSKLSGEMVKIFKNYEKRILNNEKSDLEDLLTGDNIIGQLISFSRSLIESVYRYADAVKQKAGNAVQVFVNVAIGESSEKDPVKQQARTKILKKAMKFYSQNTSHIDIVRNDELELVYFIRLPATNCLPKEVKTEFHENCDRSNIKTKQLTLVKSSSEIIEICKHEYSLKILFSSSKILALFANYVKLWKDLSFYISLVINFFILFSFSTAPDSSWHLRMTDYNLFNSSNYSQSQSESIFRALGIVMIVCSNFVLTFFLFKNVPLILHKVMSTGMQLKDHRSWFGKSMVMIVKSFMIFLSFLQDFSVLYYIMYGTLAVIGTVVHPFFFTFHLTAILMRYPTLKNVVMSIYLPGKQLLLTFLLFIVLEYSFSVWGYIQYYEEYGGRCESLLYCFLTTFDQTFKPNGGVGGFFVGNYPTDGTQNTAKHRLSLFFFDQIFQYIMLNIMINIVVGIIIDTFGVLREQSNERIQDMENYCFICGIDRTTFDRKSDSGKGFIKHIKFNHYMWNYIHFIQYLEWKERSEYTGIESYVQDLLDQKDTYWMPFKKAREVGEGDDDEDMYDLNQLAEIEKKQSQLVKEINNLIDQIGEFAKEKKEKAK